jgi:hypothetical protein
MRHVAITEGDMYGHILRLVRSPEGSDFNEDGTFVTAKRALRVTSLIKPLFPPFDAQAVASGCAARSNTSSSGSAARTPQSYYKDWAIKRMTGSSAHIAIELLLALYPLQTITRADFENELDITSIIRGVIAKDAASCRRTHAADADTTDEDGDTESGVSVCDQCRFLVSDQNEICETILPFVRRLISLSFFAFVEDLLLVDPDATAVFSEKSLVVPLDVTSQDPLYTCQPNQPELLTGTADLFLYTTAQISDGGAFVVGSERKFYVVDWKTTQHTSSSLDSLFTLGGGSSDLVPFRYKVGATTFTDMLPTTRNKHTVQGLTYAAMAKHLYGMNCDVLICMLKYSPKSAKGSGYYLSYSSDSNFKAAYMTTLLSLFV